MSTPYSGSMTQEATYWPPGVPDGFGGLNFAASVPVLLLCRWQDDAVLFRDSQGREITSSAVVYPDREIAVRGFLALGDLTASGAGTSPEAAGAFEVRQVAASPSLAGDEILHKAFL
jgi:hypothetical protein